MPGREKNYDVLEKCTEDILSLIKPVEDDRSKRLSAIQEIEISIQSLPALSGAAARPFGSFLSNLYSKSGDLDLSVQLVNSSNLKISKKKKQTLLRQLRKDLQVRGVAQYMEFIPHARVPVLQYVSSRFGISCDLSIDNYPGRIKSRIFYWINTLDERFSDMVLLVKEWAKAQNINDAKTGTLNSYSLCLLVLFHFQTCEPSILPPLKEIYEGNITEDFADMTLYDEQHLDEVCAANVAKFQSQNKERNESSLCHLLVTFFHKFSDINTLSSDVISTYTGQFKKVQDNPFWTAKSYSLIVEDPVERPDNAARAVGMKGLNLISSAFTYANSKFASLEHTDRKDLLQMLCSPTVCSKLGGRVITNSHANTPQRTYQRAGFTRRVAVKPADSTHHHVVSGGFTGSKALHNHPQGHTNATGCQTSEQPGHHQNHHLARVAAKPSDTHQNVVIEGFTESRAVHNPPQGYTDATGRQTSGQPGQHRNRNLGRVAAKPSHSTHHNVVIEGFTKSRAVHNLPQGHTDNTGRQTSGQPGQHRNHNLGRVAAKSSDSTHHNVGIEGFTGSRAVHNPPRGRIDATKRQTTGQPGQHRNHNLGYVEAKPSDSTHHNVGIKGFTGSRAVHNLPQGHTDATGCQTSGQPGQHRNHNLGRVAARSAGSTHHNVGIEGFTGSRAVHNPPQSRINATGRQTTGQPGQHRNHNLGYVGAKPSDSTHHNVGIEGFTGSRAVHNPQGRINATGRQTTGQTGQHQNHNISPGYTNTTGHQTPGQSSPYQNHNHPQVYTAGHQAAGLYQNQIHPQVRNAWIQAGGPYQNNTHQQVYNTGDQTAGPYQNHSHPRVYTSGVLQTPGSYQNFYNPTPQNHGHPQVYTTGHQTQGQYQNQQVRQYTPDRQASRNGVASAYATVLGGLQNEPAWDSLSQASSSRAAWQGRSKKRS